ncbi:ADP-ribosylglycohydrolase family protein [Streptomyces sp. NPDC057418]|uniref:ADP-ribosylglycohydrolase family protein n=1 Tax=unclassified Streptomyces TaxID=2593676 RepID=UPI0036B46795
MRRAHGQHGSRGPHPWSRRTPKCGPRGRTAGAAAVDAGGDTDTVAAVTGGPAGAVHGLGTVPERGRTARACRCRDTESVCCGQPTWCRRPAGSTESQKSTTQKTTHKGHIRAH